MKQTLFILLLLWASESFSQATEGSSQRVFSVIRTFNDQGTMLSEINYIDGKPMGKYRYFYDNGNLMEEGEWHLRYQIGTLLRYNKNGSLSQKFSFDNQGLRVGEQLYFYDTGEIRVKKIIDSENSATKIIRYQPDGRQKSYISL